MLVLGKVFFIGVTWKLKAAYAIVRASCYKHFKMRDTNQIYSIRPNEATKYFHAMADLVVVPQDTFDEKGDVDDSFTDAKEYPAPSRSGRHPKTASILRVSPSPGRGIGKRRNSVSFARTSPGPGELPSPPSLAVLSPAKELEFVGKKGQVLTSTVAITNPGQNDVVYKIKTTSPTNYRVRPNTGICQPGATIHVSIKRRDTSRLPFRDRYINRSFGPLILKKCKSVVLFYNEVLFITRCVLEYKNS